MTVFERVRSTAGEVAARARSVRIDLERLEALAVELGDAACEPPDWDPIHHYTGDPDTTLAFVISLDAVNFGSGWFPRLEKRPGCSGYHTIAVSLKERFERSGAFSASELMGLRANDCAALFGQGHADASAGDPAVSELMALFAEALRDLGTLLASEFEGRFAGLTEAAAGSAAKLVELLLRMPLYRDAARYDGFDVFFYKRAQITVMDLALALRGSRHGSFQDLDELTVFADNLVPHVLRWEGVLVYTPELLRRIERGELLQAGSAEEVEIRAVSVHAVERMVDLLRDRRGAGEITAGRLDQLLWRRGQRPECKALPRHRCRTPFY